MTELTDATFYAPLKTTLVPTNGTGNPTFTRATTKNVFDNEGKLKTVKSGAVGMAGVRCAQNLQQNSENLGNATWGKFRVTVTDNAILAPTGELTADKVVETADAGTHSLASTSGTLSATGYITTYSLYVKAAERTRGRLGDVLGQFMTTFDLSAVTVTPSVGTATIELISDGWYRVSVTSAAAVTLNYQPFLGIADDSGNLSYAGDITKGMYAFGGQVNIGPSADEYVSTGVLSNPYHGGGVDGVKYFDTDSGSVAIPDATMLGAHIDPASKTNNLLRCRDLTNAVWIKTNCTPLKTQTGIDGLASGCSLLTATAADATCLQTITAAATAACSGFWVKRSVGTGSIYITRDGGSNWTDITSLINSSAFTCVKIENTSVTNPQVGFKIATSGDAIIVDAGLNHAGTQLCEPIFTTTAAVTRNAEVLTYQTASNFSDTAGTVLATFRPTYDTWPTGSIVGKASFGLLTSTANSGVQAADGTNTVSGLAGTPSGQLRIGARWSGSSLQAFHETNYGAVGSYDGSFNLATIAINSGVPGYIRDIAIFNSSLDDADMPWYVAPEVPEVPEVPEAPTVNAGSGGGGGYRSLGSYLVEEQVSNDDRDVLDFIQTFLLTRK